MKEPFTDLKLKPGFIFTEIKVNNIPVHLHIKPYSVQLVFMCNLMFALEKGQNALLESPTGTGKTFAILYPALAWLKY
jgi:Rad3-related DNA helicase